MKSQMIIVREVGAGAVDDDHNAFLAAMQRIATYASNLSDTDLQKAQLEAAIRDAMSAFQSYATDVAQALAACRNQVLTTSPVAQDQSSGGVSAPVAAFIAVGSALAGGAAGYYVRGRR